MRRCEPVLSNKDLTNNIGATVPSKPSFRMETAGNP